MWPSSYGTSEKILNEWVPLDVPLNDLGAICLHRLSTSSRECLKSRIPKPNLHPASSVTCFRPAISSSVYFHFSRESTMTVLKKRMSQLQQVATFCS